VRTQTGILISARSPGADAGVILVATAVQFVRCHKASRAVEQPLKFRDAHESAPGGRSTGRSGAASRVAHRTGSAVSRQAACIL